ncbi:hypothetical protein FRACYDRAFT_236493 [Fragilariopsis cylindrus CCMP1102]|uniref:NADH:ubiquinone oxidoreductase intermediate-associated protein 30 domain-containing protein n=1 Tax=Fragilariopsis cylindrus CCMP1102 TaxID=635003 RepID=A0A1E7FJ60_9STRA|nr:hypothetical protein FRACYDRAFT_236493 [Fragilariopsis cylindrus CCMP1102]|eukprot:OEU18222.1 hypothetical protein FRACYDRAFT_236493 [Fragilariopsis cylindrus CCMP1102]
MTAVQVPMVEAFTSPQRHHRSITSTTAAAGSVISSSSSSSSSSKSIRKTTTSLSVVYLTADSSSKSKRSTTSTTTSTKTTNEVPIFDFTTNTNSEETRSSKSDVLKFDRIDDAIMGGISTSQLRQVVIKKDDNKNLVDDGSGNNYASWSGVCRLDGGGFCGTRTLPFKDGRPLVVQNQNGFYLKLRLDSDNEPERRVWKMTTRTQNIQTSEQVYQSSFVIPKRRVEKETEAEKENEDKTTTTTVDELESSAAMMDLSNLIIPNIRGPRIVENGPPLDVSNGIYQIGLSLSKFQIQKNVTQLDNFRDGYFNLHIKEIGVYNANNANNEQMDAANDNGTKTTATATATTGAANLLTTQTLTKEEAKNKRPLLLKILSPIATLFFNEKRNRRKSATKILRDKRGFSRMQIVKFGFQRKVKSNGIIVALGQFMIGTVSELARFVLYWSLRIGVIVPIQTIQRIVKQMFSTFLVSSTFPNPFAVKK